MTPMGALNILRSLVPGLALVLSASGAAADVVTIVSAQTPLAYLSTDQVASVFLGKSSTTPEGTRLVPINQPEGSPARDEFHARILGKSATQVKAYWSKMIFSGKGQPPAELPDDVAVRKFVSSHPGTIGYVDKGAVDSSVHILSVSDRP